jgi:hypothetical protein
MIITKVAGIYVLRWDNEMKIFTNKQLIFIGLLSACSGSAAYGFMQPGQGNLLDTLDRGMWQFRAVGGGPTGSAIGKLCVGNVTKLAQIQHSTNDCTQLVLRSSPTSVTISYNCKGAGQGITTIRKESSKLIHIDSQGIKNNSPFAFSVEARMAGACVPAV